MTAYESLTADERAAIEEAAKPLWYALEQFGWVDSHGGMEFSRVCPKTVEFIFAQANVMPQP
jgi:hypothetical protein